MLTINLPRSGIQIFSDTYFNTILFSISDVFTKTYNYRPVDFDRSVVGDTNRFRDSLDGSIILLPSSPDLDKVFKPYEAIGTYVKGPVGRGMIARSIGYLPGYNEYDISSLCLPYVPIEGYSVTSLCYAMKNESTVKVGDLISCRHVVAIPQSKLPRPFPYSDVVFLDTQCRILRYSWGWETSTTAELVQYHWVHSNKVNRVSTPYCDLPSMSSSWRGSLEYYTNDPLAALQSAKFLRNAQNPLVYYNSKTLVFIGGATVSPRVDPGSVESTLRSFASKFAPVTIDRYREQLAMVSQEAVQSARYVDINTLSNIKELANVHEEMTDIFRLLQGKISPKTLSNLYLTYKYGLRLTVKDVKEFVLALYDLYTQRDLQDISSCRSRRKYVTETYFYDVVIPIETSITGKIYYQVSETLTLSDFLRLFMDWDLYPSFQNIWDWIPYSFVVDWLFDVESALVSVDTAVYSCQLPIVSCTYGISQRYQVPLSVLGTEFTAFGTVMADYYHRFTTSEPFYALSNIGPEFLSFHNWLEAGALIIQRLPIK